MRYERKAKERLYERDHKRRITVIKRLTLERQKFQAQQPLRRGKEEDMVDHLPQILGFETGLEITKKYENFMVAFILYIIFTGKMFVHKIGTINIKCPTIV